jgi:hypothetical protein
MYSNKEDSMTISVSVKMWHKETKTEALLDSGATHNFIDSCTVTTLGMGTCKLPQELQVSNVNGTINQAGNIQRYCNLWARQGDKVIKLGFYVANLGRDRIILGHLWFKAFNPTIDWTTNRLQGEDITLETAGYHTKIQIRSNSISNNNDKEEVLKLIPEQYHTHWKVFSEKAAQRFPPSRLDDHAIKLKPGAPAKLDCKIYRQTEKELVALKEYIDKSLAKGYIEETNSPYASPLFFRAKNDGKLRPIVDYRALNNLTVRNVYPLPLIGSIINHLQGKSLFTKLDLRWGFNNIQIKESDQWKAAFKTPFGMHKPKVLPFGLSNAPATFCHAMNRLFKVLTDRYPTELFVYVDDILIATGDDTSRHHQIVGEVLHLLASESYFLRPAKCSFEQTSITYLGVIMENNHIKPDPKKTNALRDWPHNLTTIREVRSILGVLGYQRPFIPNFANIAHPLVALTKKDQPFIWTDQCTKALNTLIKIILDNPLLHQPDLSRPFFLQVDASAFATGAILTQKVDWGKQAAVGFHSQTFNDAERNYDIHDREFLAIFRGLTHHCHLLLSSPFPVTVYTDHKNLEYYRHPRHINQQVARYIPQLADYNFKLVHFPGPVNKADALSRQPDYYKGDKDNGDVTILPSHLFIRASTFSSIDDRTRACQLKQPTLLKRWATTFPLKVIGDLYWYGDRLVVVDDTPLRRGVISLYHDSPTAGHPGISNTTWAIARDYWWPNMKQTIAEYIKGCHLCQSRKNNPTKPKPPPFPIPSDNFTLPFTSVAMDFIVKLPISHGYDSILTITDTFSKACIFIPCNETIDAIGTALLYATHVLPHYGLPLRIISDRDPRFMAAVIQELFCSLSITHNRSTAYHPQTDGQSEQSNQKLEQYTRIFTNYHQTNWSRLLPLAQFAFNAWPNATTKKAPFELIMGHIPQAHQTFRNTTSPPLNDRLALITQACKDAADALRKSQTLEAPSNFTPYCVGDRVWLEGRNLNTTHPSAKLAPRRYGPFLVTLAVSRTSFRLKLPPAWKIHNVFHASLLTPYKETTINGRKYQEPAPELIDGQPEWEIEAILGMRRKRNQLQYLVRWKGYSEAHDSWEPMTHINADNLIKRYHQAHPTAIRSIYKRPPVVISIRTIQIMSTSSSPIHPSLTNSPTPSTIPLLKRISDPPHPLTIQERLGIRPGDVDDSGYDVPHPNLKRELYEIRGSPVSNPSHTPPSTSPAPMGLQMPLGYSKYDPLDANHGRYVKPIRLNPYNAPVPPHYVKFHHNFGTNQHYVYGLRDDADPPTQPYGWHLEATPFEGPLLSPNRVDNEALGVFDLHSPLAREVDAALFSLNDYGVTVDMDWYRGLMLDYETLLARQ